MPSVTATNSTQCLIQNSQLLLTEWGKLMTSLPLCHKDVNIVCADGVIKWNSLAIRLWTTLLDDPEVRGQSNFTIICPDFNFNDVSKVMDSSLVGHTGILDIGEMDRLSSVLTGFGFLVEDFSFVDKNGSVASGGSGGESGGGGDVNENWPLEEINNNKEGRKRKRGKKKVDVQKEFNEVRKVVRAKKRKKSARAGVGACERVLTPKEAALEQKIRSQLNYDENETTRERNEWLTKVVEHIKETWRGKGIKAASLDCSHYKNVEQMITMVLPMYQQRSGFPPEALQASNTSQEYLLTLDDNENVDLVLKKFPNSDNFGIRIGGKWVAYPKQKHPDFLNKSARVVTNTWWIKGDGVDYDGYVSSCYFVRGYGPWGWRNKTVATTFEERLRHCPNHNQNCPQYNL